MLTSVTSEKWKSGYQNDSSRSGACDYKRRPFVIAGAFGLVLTRVGGSDDEGIDGIGTAPLSDMLSTRVAVQAKRYDPTGKPVGREAVALFQRDASNAGVEHLPSTRRESRQQLHDRTGFPRDLSRARWGDRGRRSSPRKPTPARERPQPREASAQRGHRACGLVRPGGGRRPGSTTRACISSWAPSDTRRQRNHVQKTVGKPCAGKPHARFERGMGKQGRYAAPAPLTTNVVDG